MENNFMENCKHVNDIPHPYSIINLRNYISIHKA